ncbi:germination protein, Ger(x)C family [Ruminiclostridium papyrosolvens DSM 2782]|uniref:Germination protein, Ger(X)C family n=1 Tax=Ruminiclostridium papyrosolvens DSM 2782 TaxID=588581 RepID=F1TB76_9FIRM|nr:Ger(x)C family spore germination protein [Ruminiclostridium papyrosolvens]EGD48280.1 germination protein, Ger(x)C family [Ruminiclostridium papyrosolvens DSM 2782]WES34214.1 Ger(x)C family spore germination protein [Ruminiclostridium papyrosolvens DSM 2782]
MKKSKRVFISIFVFIYLLCTAGCWNYRELDDLAIVAGAAIDKGANGQYTVTTEVVDVDANNDTKSESKLVSMHGKTILDAIRNGISITGKKLYWSHCKVAILSKEIAEEGVTKVLDVFIRDAEIRNDVNIVYSRQDTAREILEAQETTESIKAFAIDKVLKNQIKISKAPKTDLLDYSIELQTKGISMVIPAVHLEEVKGNMIPRVAGAAIIKDDKLVGELGEEDTQALLFVRNEVKGGVLVDDKNVGLSAPISMEIFRNETKVKPVVEDGKLKFKVNIRVTVGIDEIQGKENFGDENAVNRLEASTSQATQKKVTDFIKKIQSEYGTDIFLFGDKLREKNVNKWKSVSGRWEEVFRNLEVDVDAKVHIKNSALIYKTIKRGD